MDQKAIVNFAIKCLEQLHMCILYFREGHMKFTFKGSSAFEVHPEISSESQILKKIYE